MKRGRIRVLASLAIASGAQAQPVAVEPPELASDIAATCEAATGVVPARVPTLALNVGGTYAVLSFVASGHVVFVEAASRSPVACFRTQAGAAPAGIALDDSQVVVSAPDGRTLVLIAADFDQGLFVMQPVAPDAAGPEPPPAAAPSPDAGSAPGQAPPPTRPAI